MRKHLWLVVIAVGLLGVNLGLFFTSNGGSSGIRFDESLFALKEAKPTQMTIGDQVLIFADGYYYLQTDGTREMADPAIVGHLLDLLSRIRVRRPVAEVADSNLVPVALQYSNGEVQAFEVGHNVQKTSTYFLAESQAYEVEIPGYTNYLGGIFALTADQWKDRRLLEGNWRTIQRLDITYPKSPSIAIRFVDDFFTVNGSAPADSARLVKYLDQFQNFSVNERITLAQFPRLDSLSKRTPQAHLLVDAINLKEPLRLVIYPQLTDQYFQLVQINASDWAVMEASRVASLLVDAAYFQ